MYVDYQIFCYWKDWGLVASNGAWGDATEMKKEIESISMDGGWNTGITEIRCVSSERNGIVSSSYALRLRLRVVFHFFFTAGEG